MKRPTSSKVQRELSWILLGPQSFSGFTCHAGGRWSVGHCTALATHAQELQDSTVRSLTLLPRASSARTGRAARRSASTGTKGLCLIQTRRPLPAISGSPSSAAPVRAREGQRPIRLSSDAARVPIARQHRASRWELAVLLRKRHLTIDLMLLWGNNVCSIMASDLPLSGSEGCGG